MSNEGQSITVTQAVMAALSAFPNYFAHRPMGIRVEEVVPPPHSGDVWRITISHLELQEESAQAKALRSVFQIIPQSPPTERVYHVVEVDPNTGRATAMRMRERA